MVHMQNEYGVINRSNTRDNIFDYLKVSTRSSSQKTKRHLSDDETVGFDNAVGYKRREPNVTGTAGVPVRKCPYPAIIGCSKSH